MEDVEFACLLGESEAIGMVKLQYVQARPARLIVTPVNSRAGAVIDGTIALQDIHVSLVGRRQVVRGKRRARYEFVRLFLCTHCRPLHVETWLCSFLADGYGRNHPR